VIGLVSLIVLGPGGCRLNPYGLRRSRPHSSDLAARSRTHLLTARPGLIGPRGGSAGPQWSTCQTPRRTLYRMMGVFLLTW